MIRPMLGRGEREDEHCCVPEGGPCPRTSARPYNILILLVLKTSNVTAPSKPHFAGNRPRKWGLNIGNLWKVFKLRWVSHSDPRRDARPTTIDLIFLFSSSTSHSRLTPSEVTHVIFLRGPTTSRCRLTSRHNIYHRSS